MQDWQSWPIAAVSKTAELARAPEVQILYPAPHAAVRQLVSGPVGSRVGPQGPWRFESSSLRQRTNASKKGVVAKPNETGGSGCDPVTIGIPFNILQSRVQATQRSHTPFHVGPNPASATTRLVSSAWQSIRPLTGGSQVQSLHEPPYCGIVHRKYARL